MQVLGVEIGRQEIIAVFMLVCLVVAAFFMGVQWSYGRAVEFANKEIQDKVSASYNPVGQSTGMFDLNVSFQQGVA